MEDTNEDLVANALRHYKVEDILKELKRRGTRLTLVEQSTIEKMGILRTAVEDALMQEECIISANPKRRNPELCFHCYLQDVLKKTQVDNNESKCNNVNKTQSNRVKNGFKRR